MANHLPPPAVFRAMQKFQQASGCISMVGLSGLSRWDQNGAEVATPEFPFLLEFTPLVEVHGKKGGSGGDAAVGASLLATNEHGGERRAGLRRSSTHSKKSNEDLLRELSTIKEGTRLFRVTAYASPKDKTEGNGFELGTMTTTSQCHRSVFGDTRLLFRHQRMEADFARKPEWIEELTKGGHGDGVCTPSARPVSDWQCARHAEEPLSL